MLVGVVTTLAGSSAGFLNGYGTSVAWQLPTNIYFDSTAYVLYVSDKTAVRKLTLGGTVTTVVGSATSGIVDGLGTAAEFNTLGAVAFATSGSLLVLDSGVNTIRSVDVTGIFCK